MRVLICGSRDWTDRDIVHVVLNALYEQAMNDADDLTVIHGACNTELDTRANKTPGVGADAYAHEWCGLKKDVYLAEMLPCPYVTELPYPADWGQHGKRAGFVRNAQMLAEGRPDVVYGFTNDPPSKGTAMMLDLAKKAGVRAYRIQAW